MDARLAAIAESYGLPLDDFSPVASTSTDTGVAVSGYFRSVRFDDFERRRTVPTYIAGIAFDRICAGIADELSRPNAA